MIEKELEDRMRAAVAEEPPLGFDPDELTDRAGRLRRRRRSTLAAAGAACVVLSVAVTGVLINGGQGTKVGTTATTATTAPTVPTTIQQNPACAQVKELHTVPPLNFPGSAEIVARLDEAAPRVIAKHLPGVPIEPSETGMIAYDCPPNVGTVYPVRDTDQRIYVYLIRATDTLDLALDQYADDDKYQLLAEEGLPDGSRTRTYTYKGTEFGSMLAVVRFGADGMVTEATAFGQGPAADRLALIALASDPELRF